MQIDIPHDKFGRCDYFAPPAIAAWFKEHKLGYSLCAITSWGTGEGGESCYHIPDASAEDALAFKIHFPDCKVHHSALD